MISLLNYAVCANVTDRYAKIIYSFNFQNSHAPSSKELQFEITIDPDAFISKFDADIDGELFNGVTKEKEQASKEYNEAKENDENTILISKPYDNIPNVFEIKSNIDAQSKISLHITIEQYLQKRFSFNQLNIQILRNFNKYNISPQFKHIPFTFDINDQSGIFDIDIPIKNINFDMSDKTNANHCQINGKISNDSALNELILKYKIKGESHESHVLYDSKSNTFCHIISDIITNSMVSETDIDEGQTDDIKENVLIPRRVIFVIDKSGSMSGSKWEKTISAMIVALQQLRHGYDRYRIMLFGSATELIPYTEENCCVLSNAQNVSHSIKTLQERVPGGGTNINDALIDGIGLITNDSTNTHSPLFMEQIIFITDGSPNHGVRDTKQIIDNVAKANSESQISIFSFGVGSDHNDSSWIGDLNHSFLKVLSVKNNGFYKRIKQSTADVLFTEYFTILSKPVLSNISVSYDCKNVAELTQTQWKTLFSGNDLIICGKVSNKDLKQLTATVTAICAKNVNENEKIITKAVNITKEICINIDADTYENEGKSENNIERIWAYLRLQRFAENKLLFSDMIEMDSEEKKSAESEPLALALKYRFITPWTSMLVVKKKGKLAAKPRNIKPQIRTKPSERNHKKRTKNLMLLQSDLFVMTVTTVFRNLEEEKIWIIDQSVRDKFNAKMLYELALKEDIPWRQWHQWVRDKIVSYLRQHNMVKGAVPQETAENANMHNNSETDTQAQPSDNDLKDDQECLMM